jgi:hypothetical protein
VLIVKTVSISQLLLIAYTSQKFFVEQNNGKTTLQNYATSRKVAGSILNDEMTGFFS